MGLRFILLFALLAPLSAQAAKLYFKGVYNLSVNGALKTSMDLLCTDLNVSEGWDIECTAYLSPQSIYGKFRLGRRARAEDQEVLEIVLGEATPEAYRLKKGAKGFEEVPPVSWRSITTTEDSSGRNVRIEMKNPETGAVVVMAYKFKRCLNIEFAKFLKEYKKP